MLLKYSQTVLQSLHQQGRSVKQPTEGQAEAGNYLKAHTRIHGMEISIEVPKGGKRSGVSKSGKKWETVMKSHYGYICGLRKESAVSYGPTADGDHLDCFVGPYPEVELVYVVDQVHPGSGEFDEHKCMLGFDSLAAAKAGYLENYEAGWKGMGAITPLTVQQFKSWLSRGDQTKPIAEQTVELKAARLLVLRQPEGIILVRA